MILSDIIIIHKSEEVFKYVALLDTSKSVPKQNLEDFIIYDKNFHKSKSSCWSLFLIQLKSFEMKS